MYKRQKVQKFIKKKNQNKKQKKSPCMIRKFKTNAEIKQAACLKKIFRTSPLGDIWDGLEYFFYSPKLISFRLD